MRILQWVSIVCLLGLIVLCVAWEGVLAPLRPGGTIVVAKALPLLAPLFGILHGRLYTYRWAPMLILAYMAEGLVRAWSDHGLSATLAALEAAIAVVFFFSSIFFVRATLRRRRTTAQ